MSTRMQRAVYADMFGPTTGDRVRLADTDLIIEVEKDFCTYGEEVKFGGGKVIRDGMGQSQITNKQGAVDTVITNALILDHWGIVKADVGIKDGNIHAIGKAGNPDIQPSVTIVIGPGNRGDRRRRQDSHRRRLRHAHSLHLPATGRRGADVGRTGSLYLVARGVTNGDVSLNARYAVRQGQFLALQRVVRAGPPSANLPTMLPAQPAAPPTTGLIAIC